MPGRGLLALLPALLLLLPPAAALEADFVLELEEGVPPVYEGPAGMAVLAEALPGDRYAWNLSTQEDYVVAEVRVRGAFDVERPRQVVPLLDGKHFVQVHTFDVLDVDQPARVVNITGEGPDFVYRLGIPGPTNATLVLVRDVTPPAFHVGEVTGLTHFSFHLVTTTMEPALAELRIRPAEGGDEVLHPTPHPGTPQRFPVQGLHADTNYEFHVTFWDWSGNEAASGTVRVQTLPEPELPRPSLTLLAPGKNATLPHGDVAIRVQIASPEADVAAEGVRLFVDKRPIEEGFTLVDGVLEYRPATPFTEGYHSFSVEVQNLAGGRAHVLGSFTVQVQEAPAPSFALVLLGVLALIARAVRKG